MNKSKIPLLLFISLTTMAGLCKKSPPAPVITNTALEIKGADVSYLPLVRKSGIACSNRNGVVQDMLTTLKENGVNTIRLRLWKNPVDATSSLSTVKSLCTEIKAMGLKTLISVHYSDTWADPAHQAMPAQWETASFTQLQDSIYLYTKQIATELSPDYIQIGNEINGGILWPHGSINNLSQCKILLKKASTAVREVNKNIKIVIHYAGHTDAPYFFNTITDVDYDLIGLSYYPIWHGKDLNALQQSISTLYKNTGKPIFIAETAYPFTLGWNDWTTNILGLDSQCLPAYAASQQGQYDYLQALSNLLKNTTGAIGYCYWGSEWVSLSGPTATNGSPWENQALWDFNNKAVLAVEAFK